MLRWLIHFSGVDYGARYGVWVPYNFWSGIAGSFIASIIGSGLTFFFMFYVHHVCTYSRWCIRWGHTPMAGGLGRVCHHHHPDRPPGTRGRLRGEALHGEHFAWLARQCDEPG